MVIIEIHSSLSTFDFITFYFKTNYEDISAHQVNGEVYQLLFLIEANCLLA